MFKEVLRKNKVYNVVINRIIYRIDSKDIEVNYSYKFKIVALLIYKRG